MPTVMVVEDDGVTRALVAQALQREGFAVIEADTGATGIVALREQPVALVVLDVGLPDMSGLDVVRWLRANPMTAAVPVVLLTAGGPGRELVTGLSAGADDYLVKPFDPRELGARVRAHLRSRERWLAALGSTWSPSAVPIYTPADATSVLPVFQPVVDLVSRQVVGHEALSRFADGTPPLEAFRAAHSQGVGIELEVCAVSGALRASSSLPAEHWVSVNVSPGVVLGRPDLARAFEACGRGVVVEITEHEPVHDYPQLAAALADLGPRVQVAIDDAGAGYSSLSHVLALRPDYVKLDRAWIADIADDPARRALIGGLVDFARTSGSQLIAEGVETQEELDELCVLGVDLGQGHLLGYPVALAAAT